MSESCGGCLVRIKTRSLRAAMILGAVLAVLQFEPSPLFFPSANAQDRDSPRAATSTGAGSETTVNTDDGPDTASDQKQGAGRGESSESLLTAVFHTSAPVVVVTLVIAVISFYLIAVVVWMGIHYRTPAAIPPDLVREVELLLEQNKFSEAYHRLGQDSSFLSRVLASGVRKLPSGLPQGLRAMELANEDVTMEMEHRTTYLATVGTLGPMIGLVGTVYGMIMAFHVIALEGSSPQASQLAAGISTALYATLEGIAISIPAIFFYAMYRNRIARLSLEVGMTAEPLLELFAPGVRSAVPGPGAGHGPPSPPAAHPHPLALNATIAATGLNPTRPALPAAD
jgi:biopolymer transport protein ExbB